MQDNGISLKNLIDRSTCMCLDLSPLPLPPSLSLCLARSLSRASGVLSFSRSIALAILARHVPIYSCMYDGVLRPATCTLTHACACACAHAHTHIHTQAEAEVKRLEGEINKPKKLDKGQTLFGL